MPETRPDEQTDSQKPKDESGKKPIEQAQEDAAEERKDVGGYQ